MGANLEHDGPPGHEALVTLKAFQSSNVRPYEGNIHLSDSHANCSNILRINDYFDTVSK